MEHTFELVKTVYQNAEMSKEILARMIKICNDSNLRASLAEEFAQYHEVTAQAKAIIDEHGYNIRTNHSGKSASLAGITLNTMIDKTSTHLAEMMVQGSIMGVIDMKRALKDYTGADEKVRCLANKLYETEQNNVQKMLEFV